MNTHAQIIETAKRIVPFGRQDSDNPPYAPNYECTTIKKIVSLVQIWNNDDEIIVSFRGTQPEIFLDSMRNLQTLQQLRYGGMIHAGFLKEWELIEDRVIKCIRHYWRPGKKLYITGYSQGAAIAMICTRAIQTKYESEKWVTIETYAFAGPRAGDKSFSKAVTQASPIYRFEYGDDLVPHLPPGNSGPGITPTLVTEPILVPLSFNSNWPLPTLFDLLTLIPLGLGYCHAGFLYYIDRNLVLHTDLTQHQENALARQRLGKILRHSPINIVKEHLELPNALSLLSVPV